MIRILDKLASGSPAFHATTTEDLLALQLVRKLGDFQQIGKYRILARRHSAFLLTEAFRRAIDRGRGNGDGFDNELAFLLNQQQK